MEIITLYSQYFLIGCYFTIFLLLSIYGLHRYFILYLYYRYRHKRHAPAGKFTELPHVTVQLPIYNEIYVAERLINSAVGINYPADKLEIQVVDDSTDETCALVAKLVAEYRRRGVDICHVRRDNRVGYKAGALAAALKIAKGDYLLIYDADFVADPQVIYQTIDYFFDAQVGMVQLRWGHINRNYSLLTEVQAIMLDGHFVLEHAVRNSSKRFFNFNGTAGIWRKAAILDAGGWQHDTLTEDLDLSYRAQSRGWEFIFLTDLVADGELPADINAFKSQQHRWAKGSVQTAFKILPNLLASRLPWRVKSEAFFHLTANFGYLLMLLLALLIVPTTLVRANIGMADRLFYDLLIFSFSSASISLFYVNSQRETLPGDFQRSYRFLPFLMLVGIGLSVSNTKAVLEAMLGRESEFVRTPKYRLEGKQDLWASKIYRTAFDYTGLVELLLGSYLVYGAYLAGSVAAYSAIPFMLLLAMGYLFTGVASLLHIVSGKIALFKTQVQ